MTRKPEFDRAAREAAKIADNERRAQVRRLMATLQSDPSNFEPRCLETLGRSGMELFCTSFARHTAPAGSANSNSPAPTHGRRSQGWTAEQRSELGFFSRAIAYGAGGGIAFVCLVPLLRLFSL
ncbi:hypothetical protein [Bosea sp. TAB14]|uniref:hypothetical protein n=1 Tax=Bosea sp. TAB14 TaxID=3237481 RepID=UPI003F8F51C2